MPGRDAKVEMLVNSLNNSDTDYEDAVVAKEEMKVVTAQRKVEMMSNSLNNTGSDTEYEDVVSGGESVKCEAGAEDQSEAIAVMEREETSGCETCVGSDASVEDVDDATLMAMLNESNIGMHTEDRFPAVSEEQVRISYAQEALPSETALQYRRGCGHDLAEKDVLHVSARRWFRERNCVVYRSGGTPMVAPLFWFVPLDGEDGVFLSEAMTELYMQDIPHRYGVPMVSSSKRIREEVDESRKVRRVTVTESIGVSEACRGQVVDGETSVC